VITSETAIRRRFEVKSGVSESFMASLAGALAHLRRAFDSGKAATCSPFSVSTVPFTAKVDGCGAFRYDLTVVSDIGHA
jgi:hypothetical protein